MRHSNKFPEKFRPIAFDMSRLYIKWKKFISIVIRPVIFIRVRFDNELLGDRDYWCLALFWGVPVDDEPGGVQGSDKPAVGAEHVDEQQSAGSTWSGRGKTVQSGI